VHRMTDTPPVCGTHGDVEFMVGGERFTVAWSKLNVSGKPHTRR